MCESSKDTWCLAHHRQAAAYSVGTDCIHLTYIKTIYPDSVRVTDAIWHTAVRTSSSVVYRPRPNRTVESATSRDIPIACNTCDGSIAPDVQADPVLSARVGRFAINVCASIAGKLMLLLPGNRPPRLPLTCNPGMCSWRRSSSISRSAAMRIASSDPTSMAISHAVPKPMIPGTLRVPGRISHSCPPPNVRGITR